MKHELCLHCAKIWLEGNKCVKEENEVFTQGRAQEQSFEF